jgi:hypothetical protein
VNEICLHFVIPDGLKVSVSFEICSQAQSDQLKLNANKVVGMEGSISLMSELRCV